jgi:hypothetical protein
MSDYLFDRGLSKEPFCYLVALFGFLFNLTLDLMYDD